MANDTTPPRVESSTATVQPEESRAGWLSGLRARLGLGGGSSLRDTIEGALRQEETTQSAFSAGERQMMLRMLRFGGLRVVDIMVPRADIIALEETEPLSELLRTFEEGGISRIPVFHETLDDPRGLVHIKDVLTWLMEAGGFKFGTPEPGAGEATEADAAALATPMLNLSAIDLSRPITVAKVRRPVLYVPPSMPAMNLLIRMQTTRIHMALVVDEYGGTDGLVTIEDLVEQVVGDIEDEHDEAEVDPITKDPKGGWIAAARTPISDLEEKLGCKVVSEDEAEEVDTLGGLVTAITNRVPVRGEIVHHPFSGLEFEVLDADPRRVKKLRIDPARAKSLDPARAAVSARA